MHIIDVRCEKMLKLTWLGHACFLIEGGIRVIIDPWIKGNPVAPISLDEVPKVHHIVVTHDHADHLGDTVELAKRDRAKVIAVYDLAVELQRMGVKEVIGANIGGWFKVDGIHYKLVKALHSCKHGIPVGVLLKIGNTVIYHAGDTGLTWDMLLLGMVERVNIALLPIGGFYTMDPRDAALAAMFIRPEIVIPMHYNTFPQIKQDPEVFKRMVESLVPAVKVRILKPGESIEI